MSSEGESSGPHVYGGSLRPGQSFSNLRLPFAPDHDTPFGGQQELPVPRAHIADRLGRSPRPRRKPIRRQGLPATRLRERDVHQRLGAQLHGALLHPPAHLLRKPRGPGAGGAAGAAPGVLDPAPGPSTALHVQASEPTPCLSHPQRPNAAPRPSPGARAHLAGLGPGAVAYAPSDTPRGAPAAAAAGLPRFSPTSPAAAGVRPAHPDAAP